MNLPPKVTLPMSLVCFHKKVESLSVFSTLATVSYIYMKKSRVRASPVIVFIELLLYIYTQSSKFKTNGTLLPQPGKEVVVCVGGSLEP